VFSADQLLLQESSAALGQQPFFNVRTTLVPFLSKLFTLTHILSSSTRRRRLRLSPLRQRGRPAHWQRLCFKAHQQQQFRTL
jgi:hypothetical protein